MFDHYKEARNLAGQLRKEAMSDFADKIISAMESGSTGTEIFMALRWEIGKLLEVKACSLPKHIRDKATILYDELDNALK
nr:hypothetical protein [uncultured Desulfuromonas sp.]